MGMEKPRRPDKRGEVVKRRAMKLQKFMDELENKYKPQIVEHNLKFLQSIIDEPYVDWNKVKPRIKFIHNVLDSYGVVIKEMLKTRRSLARSDLDISSDELNRIELGIQKQLDGYNAMKALLQVVERKRQASNN